ncbi:response regulator [Phyllobacterium leguminum]|uniref:response regulator n=1 Tax=Phyllobacterium leguminum TaxID=314237 RepID=UPI00315DABCD
MRILIVEDDAVLRDGLKVGLAIGGFTADAVETCEEANAVLKNHDFDALVLDLMLPDGATISRRPGTRRPSGSGTVRRASRHTSVA